MTGRLAVGQGWATLRALVQLAALAAHLRAYAAQDSAAPHPEEVAALLDFKAAITGWDRLGEYGIQLRGWGSGSNSTIEADPCTWSFVKACDSQGRVMKLVLGRYELYKLSRCADTVEFKDSGSEGCVPKLSASLQSLAAPLSRLKGLGDLALQDLGLTASLPAEWASPGGLLSRLRQLDFSKNQLTGSIPPSWSGLGSASSGVSGVPQQWPVNYLVLKSNRLTGTLPPWLPAAFPNLQTLSLYWNDLRGPLPEEWLSPGDWSSLYELDVAWNPLGGTLPSMSPPPAPNISGSDYSGAGSLRPPPSMQDLVVLPVLSRLTLDNCSLQGTLPADWAAHMPRLANLNLDYNNLTGRIPEAWGSSAGGALASAWDGSVTVEIAVRYNALSGPVPCCQHRFFVQPGNAGLCIKDADRMRAVSAGDPFIADACYPEGGGAKQGSPPGQPATNSSRGPAAGASSGRRVGGTPLRACTGTASAKLPLCRAAGQRARHQKAAAGAIIATALAALAVALGVRRWGGSKKGAGHQSLRGKDRPEEVEAGQGDCLQQERDGVAPLLPSGVLHSRGAASRPAASSAAAADGTASWRLQSTSLRLRPEDFSIVVDGAGRPELLGSGASSKVYKGLLFGHWPVAIKVLNQPVVWQALLDGTASYTASGQQQEEQEAKLWREVELLRRCTHPNIVQLLGVYSSSSSSSSRGRSSKSRSSSEPPRLMLVTELLEGGSLHERLASPALRWHEKGGQAALDVARAVAFLHQLSIAHLDIKPANVLLADTPGSAGSGVVAKLADVGLARMLGQDSMVSGCGTPLYAAPEQLVHGPCGLEADLFSLGWVLHGIATGQRLARRGEGRPLRAPQDCPAQVVSLIQCCLQGDPAARPSAAQVVQVLAQCQSQSGRPQEAATSLDLLRLS